MSGLLLSVILVLSTAGPAAGPDLGGQSRKRSTGQSSAPSNRHNKATEGVTKAAENHSKSTTITLGPDQIGIVETAQGITTRIAFREKVTEIICGDLYDPASGKGTFVVQNSGSDVFLKPIASRGMSNLFVKTEEGGGQRIYSFDLNVASSDAEAHRVVNVVAAAPAQPAAGAAVQPEVTKSAVEGAEPEPLNKEEPKPEPPTIIRKSGGVLGGEAIRKPEPPYPPRAKAAGVSGAVVVEVTVEESGNVIAARAISGHPLLMDAAVNAARGWRFNPTTVSGHLVKATRTITFNFKL